MACYYSAARACYLLLLLEPIYYLWFLAPHTAALSFSYNFSNPGHSANLIYLSQNSTPGDGVINLTNNRLWSTGGVAYPQLVRLSDDRSGRTASFTTDFSFAISDSTSNDRGDGMAFFIGTPRRAPPPDSDGGYLGLISNVNNGPPLSTLGVEFDTNRNVWDPPNPVTDHIGIDVNSISSGESYKALATGTPNPLSGTMSARIKYDGSSKVLSVSLRLANGTVYDLERTVDLKAVGVPQDATVGFSAATGNETESHQLLSWSFNSTDPSKQELPKLWVVILIAVASVAFAALVAALLWVTIMRKYCGAQRMKPPSGGSSVGAGREKEEEEEGEGGREEEERGGWRKEKGKEPPSPPSLARPLKPPMMPPLTLQVAKEFSYQELRAATSNFSKDRMLGKGSFGAVYKGELEDYKTPVAVKRLFEIKGEQWEEQRRRDYVNEITILGELNHKNLVKLVGWCNSGGGELLLVYELVTNGDLQMHLHGSSGRLLNWAERFQIVKGIGTAVEYLHTGKQNPILHRDIKPSNVMLDDDFVAKLGDFGLVRQVDPGQGSSLGGTRMIGTRVYMDPVCMSTDKVSPASDIYSFGVLLLEIATGVEPKAIEVQGSGGLLSNTLVKDVREAYARGELLQMADKRLNGEFDKGQMERVLVVGRLCVQLKREHRPKIRNAVNLLSDLSRPVPQILS